MRSLQNTNNESRVQFGRISEIWKIIKSRKLSVFVKLCLVLVDINLNVSARYRGIDVSFGLACKSSILERESLSRECGA